MRVGDGFAMGFRALALGRWHTGPGGLALARQTNDLQTVARRALEHLEQAMLHFRNQGLDPWLLFASIQQVKAYSDLGDFEAVNELFKRATSEINRFPVFMSHVQEAAGQIQLATGDPEGPANLHKAISAAEESGLLLRREVLIHNYKPYVGVGGG
jgi:hypothetical protein